MRYGVDSFGTAGTLDRIKQHHIFKGQIRYKLKLSDLPLESDEYLELTKALKEGTRIEIVFRVLS
jgi:hypothetical protein